MPSNPTPKPTVGFDNTPATSAIGFSGAGTNTPYVPDPNAPSVGEPGGYLAPPAGFVQQVTYAYDINGITADPQFIQQVAARLWQDRSYQILYNTGGQVLPEQNQGQLSRDLFSSHSRFPDIAYASISQLDPDRLSAAQSDFIASGGDSSQTTAGFTAAVTGSFGGANQVNSIIVDEAQKAAKKYGLNKDETSQLAALAIATAYTESGLNPNAVGDQGHSVGLFQLHDQGMGAGMGDSRYDPRTNAARALDSMAQTWAANRGMSPGEIAAASQRPADPTGYANTVNSLYQQVRGGKLPTISGSPAKFAGPEYTQAASIYAQYFGKTADLGTLSAIIGSGHDKQQMEDYVRSLPSHIAGVTIGQYTDTRKEADTLAQPLFGHQVTDGIVKELFDSGQTAPIQIKRFMNFLNPNLDPSVYNAIAPSVVAWHTNIANDPGADPRVVGAIASAGGAAPLPNSDAAASADSQATPTHGNLA